ncbi:SHOCT domain-containing protein [Haloarchaeobius baliensis]|uniref:SHOCT domain-containing protein n=1 Tax=Haloarchaeobius baliensis TaxID=1670458 RepID=UPI003F884AEF
MSDLLHGDSFDRLPFLVALLAVSAAVVGNLVGAYTLALVLFALGFVVLVPLTYLYADALRGLFGGDPESDDAPDPTSDALAELRRMHERAELTDAEFERRAARVRAVDGEEPASAAEPEQAGSTDAAEDHDR